MNYSLDSISVDYTILNTRWFCYMNMMMTMNKIVPNFEPCSCDSIFVSRLSLCDSRKTCKRKCQFRMRKEEKNIQTEKWLVNLNNFYLNALFFFWSTILISETIKCWAWNIFQLVLSHSFGNNNIFHARDSIQFLFFFSFFLELTRTCL